MIATAVAGALTAFCPGVGAAQESKQTAEGANAFLKSLAETQALSARFVAPTGAKLQRADGDWIDNSGLDSLGLKIANVEMVSKCVSRFTLQGRDDKFWNWAASTIKDISPKTIYLTVDWSRISKISAADTGIKDIAYTGAVAFAGDQPLKSINVLHGDYAERIAWATEFLRLECDRISSTGF
jgi:hypothetical protein